MKNKHQSAGRLGGLTTLMRYGREFYSTIGAKGGRPKATQLGRQTVLAANSKVEGGWIPNRLSELKELWRQNKKEGMIGA